MFEATLTRHLPVFVAIAARMLGDEALAHDAVQDAAFNVHKRFAGTFPNDELTDAAALARYLRAAVVNAARNELRDRVRRESAAPTDVDGTTEQFQDPKPEQIDRALLLAEDTQRVNAALARVTNERYRRWLWLHHAEGLTWKEIAELDGVCPGTVSSGVHRALVQFKGAMEELQEVTKEVAHD